MGKPEVESVQCGPCEGQLVLLSPEAIKVLTQFMQSPNKERENSETQDSTDAD